MQQTSGRVVRALLDGTRLLGQGSGIARYSAVLLAELVARSDVDGTVTAFPARGQVALRRMVSEGVRVRREPVPARAFECPRQRHARWESGGHRLVRYARW